MTFSRLRRYPNSTSCDVLLYARDSKKNRYLKKLSFYFIKIRNRKFYIIFPVQNNFRKCCVIKINNVENLNKELFNKIILEKMSILKSTWNWSWIIRRDNLLQKARFFSSKKRKLFSSTFRKSKENNSKEINVKRAISIRINSLHF
jgi:hypothetical protein